MTSKITKFKEFYHKVKNMDNFNMQFSFKDETLPETPKGTVGCVALDIHGNICAGKF
jgi:isoaspartyl peptidase/L-asparaginase-like protein (Ntn-hydrolase superfamily)